MNETNYTQRTQALFRTWLQQLKDDTTVGSDGAVDPARYFASKPRIVFLLKEMNAEFWLQQNLNKYLAEHADRGQTWNNVVRWTRVIKATLGEAASSIPVYEEHRFIGQAERLAELAQIAAVNMKKLPGTGNSHMPTVNLHAERYGELLADQLELLDPHVVVACGVDPARIKALSHAKQPEACWAMVPFSGRDRLFIWSHHPAARGKDGESFDFMVRACTKAREQNGVDWMHSSHSTNKEQDAQ